MIKTRWRLVGVAVALLALAASLHPANVLAENNSNDFHVQAFTADYYLSRTDNHRSQLHITEKIDTVFLPGSRAHGIERAIPETYDGHTVSLHVDSVTATSGQVMPFTTYESNGNTVVRIGNPNVLVSGEIVYNIDYDVHDIAKHYKDHDELYWNTNGTDWGVTFGSVTARLHLNNDMTAAFNGQTRCYVGVSGATASCDTSTTKTADETVLTFQSNRMLYAGENVSFVAGFKPQTFTGYHPTQWERLRPWLWGAWTGLGLLVLVGTIWLMIKVWREQGRSPAGAGTIVPEYQPPKDYSVLTASTILKQKGSDITAQILDLAVRGFLRIYETDTRGTWFRNKYSYDIELAKPTRGLRSEERQLVEIVFGKRPKAGDRVTIELLRSKLYSATRALEQSVAERARKDGYVADKAALRKQYYTIGGLLLAGGIVTLNIGIAVAGIVTLIVTSTFHPLTKKGVKQRDYLKGLNMYMKLAEADRIKYLQSPKGVQKTPVNPRSKKQLLKLYEQLLPYAVVMGIEREWAKEFAPLYKDKAPDWYVGNWNGFNAGLFVASIGGFTTAGNSTFSAPTSSSASGFSAGGGFSGGGGGGGGGGSW